MAKKVPYKSALDAMRIGPSEKMPTRRFVHVPKTTPGLPSKGGKGNKRGR